MAEVAAGALRDRQWRGAAVLAWHDFRHEWRVSLCLIFALAAVLVPLLVLFGIKTGIVKTMADRLKADPVNREIVIRGHHAFGASWFAAMAADATVGFVVPKTRFLSATVTLASVNRTLQDLDMVPTAPGDPLVPAEMAVPSGVSSILLSHSAAVQLNASTGSTVRGTVARRRGERAEGVEIPLTVRGVLPETAVSRDAAFVSLQLLTAVEDYRNGLAVPELGVHDGELPGQLPRVFASARLYARGLDDVAALADRMRAQSVEVVTRAHDIETVKAIDRVLTLLFVVLASIAALGYLISLAASLWANVDRKRREIALLRLVGLRNGPVLGFPAVQAALIACGGVLVSVVAYALVATLFNYVFATYLERDELVCVLRPIHATVAVGLTLSCALVASIVGGYRAIRIDPAESLREL